MLLFLSKKAMLKLIAMETTEAWHACSGWFSIYYWEQEWHIEANFSFQLHIRKIVSIPWFFWGSGLPACLPLPQYKSDKKIKTYLEVGWAYPVLNRTVCVDSDWRFDNLCGSYLQSQSELYHVSSNSQLSSHSVFVRFACASPSILWSRLYCAGNCWLRFSGVCSKLVNQLSELVSRSTKL